MARFLRRISVGNHGCPIWSRCKSVCVLPKDYTDMNSVFLSYASLLAITFRAGSPRLAPAPSPTASIGSRTKTCNADNCYRGLNQPTSIRQAATKSSDLRFLYQPVNRDPHFHIFRIRSTFVILGSLIPQHLRLPDTYFPLHELHGLLRKR